MTDDPIIVERRRASYDELPASDRELVDTARRATSRAYAPYSHFHVGAAIRLSDGTVIEGSNQENAAYPSGTCAERTRPSHSDIGCGHRRQAYAAAYSSLRGMPPGAS